MVRENAESMTPSKFREDMAIFYFEWDGYRITTTLAPHVEMETETSEEDEMEDEARNEAIQQAVYLQYQMNMTGG